MRWARRFCGATNTTTEEGEMKMERFREIVGNLIFWLMLLAMLIGLMWFLHPNS